MIEWIIIVIAIAAVTAAATIAGATAAAVFYAASTAFVAAPLFSVAGKVYEKRACCEIGGVIPSDTCPQSNVLSLFSGWNFFSTLSLFLARRASFDSLC